MAVTDAPMNFFADLQSPQWFEGVFDGVENQREMRRAPLFTDLISSMGVDPTSYRP